MSMMKNKDVKENKEPAAVSALHSQVRGGAVSRVKQVQGKMGASSPKDTLPKDVSTLLQPAWAEVMKIFNSIVSGGRQVIAHIEPDAKTTEEETDEKGKTVTKTIDPKYSKVQGKAFIKGKGDKGKVAMNDVNQGYLGDCYFIASLAALAQRNPAAIKQGIKDNGDGTYTVKFPGEGAEVLVDGAFPTTSGDLIYAQEGDVSGKDKELWVVLYEKAWAKLKGGYEQIQGGKVKMKSKDAMQAVTGKASTKFQTTSKSKKFVFDAISKAVSKGLPITAGTYGDKHFDQKTLGEMDKKGVHGDHAYAVRGVDANKRIKLYNPWGAYAHVENLTIDEFVKYYRVVHINGK